MERLINIAVLGATGTVGNAVVEQLEEREYPVNQLFLLSSDNGAGETLMYKGKRQRVQNVADFDWSQVEIAIFVAGEQGAKEWATVATDAGCLVIDSSAAFTDDPDIPQVIPEINAGALAQIHQSKIVVSPSCAVIASALVLKPIHDEVGITQVNISTYQSVSSAGKKGISTLANQTAKLLNAKPIEPDYFAAQIAFNCIPQSGNRLANGYSQDEMLLVSQTQRILSDPELKVSPTCVVVPVFHGLGAALHIETRFPLEINEITGMIRDAQGVELVEEADEIATQVSHAVGQDTVYVDRVRKDLCSDNGIQLWLTLDNLKKGSATNLVQIAEHIGQYYL
ncbi:aspartate-semialdehyde dehydrogenase [Motilimonas cestriensis]|uniref:Aspartate-semialdehyde dehydrogenase n=1 Tax=Motilimonas cestriensis TaxID=2742685 RepID=A0ABS8W3E8_9GAMM|nr:aspartate-semialdehyde dehydrogenase [Motilimonas cestriensis]MCE2593454.1 aspartate-semialdehyde dehydrogenase [Motilimonas cestriensis]